jgi:mono/diheme cytochrome c family protein
MPTRTRNTLIAAAMTVGLVACDSEAKVGTEETSAKRGEYLVTIMGCGDCHTPGYFFGKPDESQKLAGSDVGFFMPGLGYYYGRNLTPDKKTGLGDWSDEQIAKAIRNGERPDGRILAPIMPYQNFAKLSDTDLTAIVAYLRTLKPVHREAPPPTGADQTPPAAFMSITMPPKQSASATAQ